MKTRMQSILETVQRILEAGPTQARTVRQVPPREMSPKSIIPKKPGPIIPPYKPSEEDNRQWGRIKNDIGIAAKDALQALGPTRHGNPVDRHGNPIMLTKDGIISYHPGDENLTHKERVSNNTFGR